VLHCVAVCFNVLQCVAVCNSIDVLDESIGEECIRVLQLCCIVLLQ